jgi:general secretion pathway protein D
VEIEAAIVEVTLTDQLRFGVQGLYSNGGLSAGLTESLTSAAPVAAFPGFSALYSARTVSAALNALESLTKVNVVSAPKLLVLNNQTASIQVGNEVPILTGSATNVVTSNAAVVNSVDYRDTGIILKVTPRVNSSGFVLLDLAQEVSDVVASGSAATIDSPTFSNRKIATSVAIQDGEVIALGGLIRDNRTDIKTGLPLLSRIPLLGPLLFGNINNDDERTELIVLLQPKVVKNVDDARAVTEELRDKLQSLRALLPAGKAP